MLEISANYEVLDPRTLDVKMREAKEKMPGGEKEAAKATTTTSNEDTPVLPPAGETIPPVEPETQVLQTEVNTLESEKKGC